MKIIQYSVSHTVFILNAQMIKQIDAIQSMIFLTIKMTFFVFWIFWHFESKFWMLLTKECFLLLKIITFSLFVES